MPAASSAPTTAATVDAGSPTEAAVPSGTATATATLPSPTPIATPGDPDPVIALDLPDDHVRGSDPFTIRLEGRYDGGLRRIWWWVEGAEDDRLWGATDCAGERLCRGSWQVSTWETGSLPVKARAEAADGRRSAPADWTVEIRASGTATPTPSPTGEPTPTASATTEPTAAAATPATPSPGRRHAEPIGLAHASRSR